MSTFKQFIGLGKESAYGSPVSATTYYEARTDDWTRETEPRMSGGFRAGALAQPSALHTLVQRGVTGTLEVPVTTAGMGLILGGLVAAPPTPGTVDATNGGAVNSFAVTEAGPTTSYTILVGRQGTSSGSLYSYAGCIAESWTLDWSNASPDPLVLSVSYVGSGETKGSFPTSDPTAYAEGPMYGGEDLAVTVKDSSDTVNTVTSVAFTVDNSMATDLRYLQQVTRSQPIREDYPAITGTLTVIPTSSQEHDWFTAETLVAVNLKAAKKTPFVSGKTVYPTFEINLPTCKILSATPQMTVSGLTTVSVEFMAMTDLSKSSPSNPLTVSTTTEGVDAV